MRLKLRGCWLRIQQPARVDAHLVLTTLAAFFSSTSFSAAVATATIATIAASLRYYHSKLLPFRDLRLNSK